MPISVFGKSSNVSEIKIVNIQYVQKPYLRTNYIEKNIEEDLDLVNQFENKNLPCSQKNSDAVCESYVESGLNDPIVIRNTAHDDFNGKNLDNVRFVKVNSLSAVRVNLTTKTYVDEAVSPGVDE